MLSDAVLSISPSAYIAYHNLRANYFCADFGNATFGRTYNTTIAYPPDSLSTMHCDFMMPHWANYTAINYTQLQYPATDDEVAKKCSLVHSSNVDTGSPTLSIPLNVKSVDPLWNTCEVYKWGVFDPPRTLDKVTALFGPSISLSPVATPGAVPSPANAPTTLTPTANVDRSSERQLNSPTGDPVDPNITSGPKQTIGPESQQSQQNVHSQDYESVVQDKSPNSLGIGGSIPSSAFYNVAFLNDNQQTKSIELVQTPQNGGNGNKELNSVFKSNFNVDLSFHTESIDVDDHPIGRISSGGILFADSIVAPEIQATISGHILSAGLSDAVVDGITYTLPEFPSTSSDLSDDEAISRASDTDKMFDDANFAEGAQASMSSHIISAGLTDVKIDDAATYAFPANAETVSQPTANGLPELITALANEVVVTPGSPAVVVTGTTFSIAPDSSSLMVNSKIKFLSTKLQSIFILDGHIFTAIPTDVAIDGQTVSLGGSVGTISGPVLSLGSSGFQVGSSIRPIGPAEETASSGLGDIIMSGWNSGPGGAGGGTNGSGSEAFTGDCPRGGRIPGIVTLAGYLLCIRIATSVL